MAEGNTILEGAPAGITTSGTGTTGGTAAQGSGVIEGTTTVISDSAVSAAAAKSEPFNFIGEDLSFTEGWQGELADKLGDKDARSFAIRDDATLKNVKTLPDAMHMIIDSQRMVGADKIEKPSANSTKEVWEAAYQALGRPDTALDYKIEYPKETTPSEDEAKQHNEKFFDLGLSQKQAQDVVNYYNTEILGKATQKIESDRNAEILQTNETLKKDWGLAFDQKSTEVRNFVNNLGLTDMVKTNGLGNNLVFIKAMENLTKRFSEEKDLIGSENIRTPVDAQTEINRVHADPAHPYNDPNSAGHAKAVEYVTNLYSQLSGKK